MKLQKYIKTWEGVQTENQWSRIIQLGLIILLLLLAAQSFRKKEVVILQPFTLTEQAWVTQHNASQSYKEAWGFALAQLFGNVTPATVDFVKTRVAPLLAPCVYQEVIDALEVQARQIKDDRIAMRFEPRLVEYEPQSDKVFIQGFAYLKGVSGPERRVERTYELIIKVAHYAPMLQYIDTYAGKPRTQSVLEQDKHKQAERSVS